MTDQQHFAGNGWEESAVYACCCQFGDISYDMEKVHFKG